MSNKYYLALFSCIVGLSANTLMAAPVAKIESYGIYVAGKDGFTKLKPYKPTANRFIEFKHLNGIPAALRNDKKLKLVVFSKTFEESEYQFELQLMTDNIHLEDVSFDVKPLGNDRYELALDKDVPDGTVVLVSGKEFYQYNFGAAMLGDTQGYLETYFSNTDNDSPGSMLSKLQEASSAFPKNEKLKGLVPTWEKLAKDAKDNKDYGYVEEAWSKYEGAEKLSLQRRYLRTVVGEVNSYLQEHPKGKKAKEAAERKAFAEKKIVEIDKQL